MLDKLISITAGILGLVLFGMGMTWILDPGRAAGFIGMPLLVGVAGNSQIGDLGAFFIVTGGFALLGLYTRNAILLYTPAALVGGAAVLRVLAGLIHDTDFAVDMIIAEIFMCAIFLLARKRLAAGPPRT